MNLNANSQPSRGWELDRRIGVAVLLTLAFETFAGLIWAGRATERLANVERRVSGDAALVERLVRLEERVAQASHQLERIEKKLDR